MPACGQVSWLSDRPTPHAFPARADPSQWLIVGFVPDYSDGVAADSHRLPWGPRSAGRPDTVNTLTVTERDGLVKQGTAPAGPFRSCTTARESQNSRPLPSAGS